MGQPIGRYSPLIGRRRLCVSLGIALLSLLVAPVPALAGPGSESFVTMISDPGDYVGQGRHRFFHTGNASITVEGTAGYATVIVSGGNLGDSYRLVFAAPPGETLQVREYERAQRAPFRKAGRPGIDIGGDGRGCNTIKGRFRVKHISVAADGTVSGLWVVYEQHCEGWYPALFGEVRYRIPGDGGDVTLGPREVRWPSADPGTSMRAFPVIVHNTASQEVEMAASSITGPSSVEFEVRNDECAGQTLASGKICRVFVRYLAQTPGLKQATLTVPEADGALHVVKLEGFAFSGTTRFDVESEEGDYVGEGHEYTYLPSNARITAAGGYEYVWADVTGADGTDWFAEFQAPAGDVLVPGTTYTGGFGVSGNYRGCSHVQGEFTVTEIYVNEYGELERFGAFFEQHCHGDPPALWGILEFRVNETIGGFPKVLVVAASGSGSGTITSNDGLISCGPTCDTWYEWGAAVTLSAEPASDSQFTGWSWACSGTGSCQIEMTVHSFVTATFDLKTVAQQVLPGQQTLPPQPQPPPGSTGKTPTTAHLRTAKGGERMRVSGSITPALAGGQVTVILFRKQGGVFERIARKRLALDSASKFMGSFSRPAPGRCRVVVRFGGDGDHLSSQASRTLAC